MRFEPTRERRKKKLAGTRCYLDAQDEDGAVLSAREDEVVIGSDNQGRHRTGVHGELEARRHVLRQRPVVHADPTAVRVLGEQEQPIVDISTRETVFTTHTRR